MSSPQEVKLTRTKEILKYIWEKTPTLAELLTVNEFRWGYSERTFKQKLKYWNDLKLIALNKNTNKFHATKKLERLLIEGLI